MDLFEKYLSDDKNKPGDGSKGLQNRESYKIDNPITPLWGRANEQKKFAPGTKVNHLIVVGPATQQGRNGPYTNREYTVECAVATRDGGTCGNRGRVTYHQLYYGTVWSCGCTKRPKHPPMKLEGQRIGQLEVLRWAMETDGYWECICHECGKLLYRKTVKQLRMASESCESHDVEIA